jgi:uncharacterized SAM-binding protein YcdF (DUF218 family)
MYQFITQLLQPYTLICLLLAALVVHLWWRRRETRGRLWLLTIPVAGLIVISLPWITYLARGSLEWQYDRLERRPADVDAIVVLGGGIRWPDAGHRQAELTLDTISRCLEAARLYHQGKPCRVVVSGGKEYPGSKGPSAAEVMRDFLVKRLGVNRDDIDLEASSQTTYENAVECGQVLRRRGLGRVVLVTEATHMPRALGCFRSQGIDAVPGPCRFSATELRFEAAGLLPNVQAAETSQRVFHEWMGWLWYSLKGRV